MTHFGPKSPTNQPLKVLNHLLFLYPCTAGTAQLTLELNLTDQVNSK